MKRQEVYQRNYDWQVVPGSHGHESWENNPDDKITHKLSASCIHVSRNLNLTTHSLESDKFLWYENGIFLLTVEIKPGNEDRAVSNYGRSVTIEAMPETAPIPVGLAKLLEDNFFRKVKLE